MRNKASIKLVELLEPVVTALGYELYGIEYQLQGRHSLLRIYIDTEQGIAIEDCERVSHQVSGVLDVEDPIQGAYTLEVSSPGMDRPLFKPEHFERYAGSLIKIVTQAPINGQRKFSGRLVGLREQDVVLALEAGELVVPYDSVDKANIIPEF